MNKRNLSYYASIFAPLALLVVMGVVLTNQPSSGVPGKASDWRNPKAALSTANKLAWQHLGAPAREKRAWPTVKALAFQHGLEPALVMAVVKVESNFRPWALSQRGAMGLMQINRVTARHLGLQKPLDPRANLKAGVRYLANLMRMFDGKLRLGLAAYNAGPTRVQADGAVPDIKETQAFVERVLRETDYYRSKYQALAKN